MGLRDLLTPDNYRDYVLPALGVTEAIATRGRSPGTAAQGQMTAFDKEKDDKYTKGRQAMLDAQTAAKDALQNRLGTLQIGNAENEQAQNLKKQAAISALQGKLGALPDEQAYYDAFPEKYGDRLKPESNVYLPGANGYFVAPRTGSPSAIALKDAGGNTVVPPPKAGDKSIEEITAEAAARARGAAEGNPDAHAPKQNQSSAAGFGKRAILAQSELDELVKSGFDPSADAGLISSLMPNAMQSGSRQRFGNAKENFISAVLRKESGASISPSERSGADYLYFPQPGDKPEAIKQKSRARAAAIASLQAEAGPAWAGVADVSSDSTGKAEAKIEELKTLARGGSKTAQTYLKAQGMAW